MARCSPSTALSLPMTAQARRRLIPSRGRLAAAGAVPFGSASPQGLMMVDEGIETCLAVMQATGRPAWAALSTSGLKALDLPTTVGLKPEDVWH